MSVLLSYGLSRQVDQHITKQFGSRREAKAYVRDNLFPGVSWWIDDCEGGKCLEHGVRKLKD